MFVDYFPVRLVITDAIERGRGRGKEKGRGWNGREKDTERVDKRVRLNRTWRSKYWNDHRHTHIFMRIIPKYNNVDLLNGISKHTTHKFYKHV